VPTLALLHINLSQPTSADTTHVAEDIAKQHHILDIRGVNSQDTPGWGAAAERIQNLEQGSPDFAELPLAQRSAEAGGEAETALSEKGSASPGNEEETLRRTRDLYPCEEERQHKSDIWHEVNKDSLEEWHLRNQEARRKKKKKNSSSNSRTALQMARNPQAGQAALARVAGHTFLRRVAARSQQ